MPQTNRQWLLKQRPQGMVTKNDFEYVESPMPSADLAAGDILVKNLYLSFDPAMRGWMDDVPSYLPPVALGEPMRASSVSEVIESQTADFPVGTLIQGMYGWQEYAVASASDLMPPRALPEGTPPTMPLSIFGATSLTAYFGLLDVGALQTGETVLVSGAAGATGSAVAQIAKIKGCRVVGIAGGKEKCDWLLDSCHLDAVIDYKSEALGQRIGELCPDGVNVFFDNVGGEILEAAIDHMAEKGRIVLCGQIASYNDVSGGQGPRNIFKLIVNRIRMEGFVMIDYLDRIDEAMNDLVPWVMEGKMVYREDIQEGFENIPDTFFRLFSGKNNGKQLLKLAGPSDS